MAEIALEFVHKGPAGSVPKVEGNNKDETLVYLGERLGQVTSRVGSVGRVLRCNPQLGEASVALFNYHGPAKEALGVVAKIGAEGLKESVALAHIEGKFYMVEKSYAFKECGSLGCV